MYLCNGCHYLMPKAMNFNDVAIVSIKGYDYEIHSYFMSKDNAKNKMKNSDLNAIQLHKKLDYYKFFTLYKNE